MMLQNFDLTGFFKVAESGGTFVTNTFYNPTTGETVSGCVRDYDYSDRSRDLDELYNLPIDEANRVKWLHSRGQILTGDVVQVVKGRKVPLGTVGKVYKMYPYHDKYGRKVADYVCIEGGYRTNVNNCILFEREGAEL